MITNLKRDICAVNKVLKDVVETMSVLELLRNVHPDMRSYYAFEFYKAKTLTREEIEEFNNDKNGKLRR